MASYTEQRVSEPSLDIATFANIPSASLSICPRCTSLGICQSHLGLFVATDVFQKG